MDHRVHCNSRSFPDAEGKGNSTGYARTARRTKRSRRGKRGGGGGQRSNISSVSDEMECFTQHYFQFWGKRSIS